MLNSDISGRPPLAGWNQAEAVTRPPSVVTSRGAGEPGWGEMAGWGFSWYFQRRAPVARLTA